MVVWLNLYCNPKSDILKEISCLIQFGRLSLWFPPAGFETRVSSRPAAVPCGNAFPLPGNGWLLAPASWNWEGMSQISDGALQTPSAEGKRGKKRKKDGRGGWGGVVIRNKHNIRSETMGVLNHHRHYSWLNNYDCHYRTLFPKTTLLQLAILIT